MAIFRNLRACPVAPEDGTGVRLRFESLKYFNVFLRINNCNHSGCLGCRLKAISFCANP